MTVKTNDPAIAARPGCRRCYGTERINEDIVGGRLLSWDVCPCVVKRAAAADRIAEATKLLGLE